MVGFIYYRLVIQILISLYLKHLSTRESMIAYRFCHITNVLSLFCFGQVLICNRLIKHKRTIWTQKFWMRFALFRLSVMFCSQLGVFILPFPHHNSCEKQLVTIMLLGNTCYFVYQLAIPSTPQVACLSLPFFCSNTEANHTCQTQTFNWPEQE